MVQLVLKIVYQCLQTDKPYSKQIARMIYPKAIYNYFFSNSYTISFYP